MAVPALTHDEQVRATLPPGLRPVLDRLAPVPREASRAASPEVEDELALLGSHLAGRSANTRRAYAADWRRRRVWCERNGRTALPADPGDVALYLASAHLTDPGAGRPANSSAAVARWSGAIAAVHTAHDLPTPTTRPPAAAVLRLLRARGSTRRPASRPLTDAEFRRLLAALPPPTSGPRPPHGGATGSPSPAPQAWAPTRSWP